MTTIRREHLIQSVADSLQFISYYHPLDYLRALGRAYERKRSPAEWHKKIIELKLPVTAA